MYLKFSVECHESGSGNFLSNGILVLNPDSVMSVDTHSLHSCKFSFLVMYYKHSFQIDVHFLSSYLSFVCIGEVCTVAVLMLFKF